MRVSCGWRWRWVEVNSPELKQESPPCTSDPQTQERRITNKKNYYNNRREKMKSSSLFLLLRLRLLLLIGNTGVWIFCCTAQLCLNSQKINPLEILHDWKKRRKKNEFKKYIKKLWIKKWEGGSIPWLFCHVRDVLSLSLPSAPSLSLSLLSEIPLSWRRKGEKKPLLMFKPVNGWPERCSQCFLPNLVPNLRIKKING